MFRYGLSPWKYGISPWKYGISPWKYGISPTRHSYYTQLFFVAGEKPIALDGNSVARF